MTGEGAKHSMFSKMINVAIIMESTDEIEERNGTDAHSNEYSFRNASMVLAEYLGNAVKEANRTNMRFISLIPS